MQYLNLDIEIQPAENPDSPREHRLYPLTASRSIHPIRSSFTKRPIAIHRPIRLNKSEADLETRLNMVQNGLYTTDTEYLAPQPTVIPEPDPSAISQPLTQVPPQPSHVSLQIRRFGEELFKTLFGGPGSPLYEAYASMLHAAKQHKARRLRIRLSLQADELSYLPWELLYDPHSLRGQGVPGYLCRHPFISLVRSLDLKHHVSPTPMKLPLSVCNVLALSNKEWETARERELGAETLDIFAGLAGKVTIKPQLETKSEQRLREVLSNSTGLDTAPIFHFIGHGGFDDGHREGFLEFADDSRMSAGDLSDSLSSRNVCLAVLNTCEGARGDASDRFASTAAKLAQQGIPAVVAMQYKITYSASLGFARAFYAAFSEHGDVDSAIIAARQALTAQPSSLEWASPVLYLNSDSGQLFKIRQSQDYIRQIQALPRKMFTALKKRQPAWVRPLAGLLAVLVVIALLWPLIGRGAVASCSASFGQLPANVGSSSPLPSLETQKDSNSDEQIGLSIGGTFFDKAAYSEQKTQIEHAISLKNISQALGELEALSQVDQNDAEFQIYYADQQILSQHRSHIIVVLGLGFPILIGGTRDILQGAFLAQQKWNQDHSQPQLLVVVANTGFDPTGTNATIVMKQIISLSLQKNQQVVGIVGWPDSTNSINTLQALGSYLLTMISPATSGDGVSGPNFFRIVPPDKVQASLAVAYALSRWPRTKRVALIATAGSSKIANYGTNLAADFNKNLLDRNITVAPQYYNFNDSQSVQSALKQALSSSPDLIFFTGYARDLQTLLEAQSQYPKAKLRNTPIIAGDAASNMNDYTELPPGFDHTYFTAFASQPFDIASTASDFFSAFSHTFPHLTLPTQVTDVDEDVILGYDALQTLLYGYQYQSQHGISSLTKALQSMGGCQGVSGRIIFSPGNGNPIDKVVVLEQVLKGQLIVLTSSGTY